MTDPAPFAPTWTTRRIALLLAAASFLAVALTIDGPGLTVDEPLDVRPGRTYLETLRAKGWGFFDRRVSDAVFRDNAEHPPLGRWLLGLASTLGEPIEILLMGGPDPTGLYVVWGRLAPALAFGLLVGLVSAEGGRRWGRAAGIVSGVSLAIMPRAFAHAHLAALDTFIAAAWAIALLASARAIESRRPSAMMALSGLAWGLALLTKIQAWLLPPIVLAWAVARLGPKRAFIPVLLWTVVGLLTFLGGWPWLWHDTWARWAAYLGTGVDRISIRVLYFGTIYADRDLPWHYPWFYFAVTVPVGLHALGFWGLVRGVGQRRSDPFPLLLVGAIAVFLVLFSTRAPVYDGERLFLAAFPPWAILIGRGFADAWDRASRRLRAILIGLVAMQAYGVLAIHPFGLSYYNALVGGLPGAERLGLELTYWGDSVDRKLLGRLAREAKEGETGALIPTLAPEQGKCATTRALAQVPMVLGDQEAADSADWLVVSRREAYWPATMAGRLADAEVVETRSRHGVWLSRLVRIRKTDSP